MTEPGRFRRSARGDATRRTRRRCAYWAPTIRSSWVSTTRCGWRRPGRQ